MNPSSYPHAYLVTTARFLGYQYNPVSFWYLYDGKRALTAVIVEVNNPFGERHLYYLPAGSRPKKLTDSVVLGMGDSKTASLSARFSQTWAKNFHVSPFNSRKGSYSITALDPATADAQGLGPIDTTIVLRSSHGHEKIVARLFSAGPAVDPIELTAWQAVCFVVTWWWVDLATFPRILKETGVLFFREKLHIWLRPEPLRESVSRLANGAERRLEAAFRCYLRHLVENQAASAAAALRPLAVTYIPCGIPEASTEQMLSPAAACQRDGDVDEVEIKALTPVFYARFVCYAHDVEALFCELRESCTVDVSRPELLAKLALTRVPRPPLQVTGAVDFLFFKAIQKLRRRPERLERPMTWPRGKLSAASAVPAASYTSGGDLRGFRLSAMDGFVLALQGASGHDTRRSYRATVLALFLAERTALGSYRVFLAQCLSVRFLVAWAVARTVSTLRSYVG